jgi:hypothetical protein
MDTGEKKKEVGREMDKGKQKRESRIRNSK